MRDGEIAVTLEIPRALEDPQVTGHALDGHSRRILVARAHLVSQSRQVPGVVDHVPDELPGAVGRRVEHLASRETGYRLERHLAARHQRPDDFAPRVNSDDRADAAALRRRIESGADFNVSVLL